MCFPRLRDPFIFTTQANTKGSQFHDPLAFLFSRSRDITRPLMQPCPQHPSWQQLPPWQHPPCGSGCCWRPVPEWERVVHGSDQCLCKDSATASHTSLKWFLFHPWPGKPCSNIQGFQQVMRSKEIV